MKEQTLQKDDNVRVVNASGFPRLIEGEVVTVLSYEPEYRDPAPCGFTWPAYVWLELASGKTVYCHASRVRLVSDQDNQ